MTARTWTVEFDQADSTRRATVSVPARSPEEAIAAARGMAAWLGHAWARTTRFATAKPARLQSPLSFTHICK